MTIPVQVCQSGNMNFLLQRAYPFLNSVPTECLKFAKTKWIRPKVVTVASSPLGIVCLLELKILRCLNAVLLVKSKIRKCFDCIGIFPKIYKINFFATHLAVGIALLHYCYITLHYYIILLSVRSTKINQAEVFVLWFAILLILQSRGGLDFPTDENSFIIKIYSKAHFVVLLPSR